MKTLPIEVYGFVQTLPVKIYCNTDTGMSSSNRDVYAQLSNYSVMYRFRKLGVIYDGDRDFIEHVEELLHGSTGFVITMGNAILGEIFQTSG